MMPTWRSEWATAAAGELSHPVLSQSGINIRTAGHASCEHLSFAQMSAWLEGGIGHDRQPGSYSALARRGDWRVCAKPGSRHMLLPGTYWTMAMSGRLPWPVDRLKPFSSLAPGRLRGRGNGNSKLSRVVCLGPRQRSSLRQAKLLSRDCAAAHSVRAPLPVRASSIGSSYPRSCPRLRTEPHLDPGK